MRLPVLVWGKLVVVAFAFAKGTFSSASSEDEVTVGADLVLGSSFFNRVVQIYKSFRRQEEEGCGKTQRFRINQVLESFKPNLNSGVRAKS